MVPCILSVGDNRLPRAVLRALHPAGRLSSNSSQNRGRRPPQLAQNPHEPPLYFAGDAGELAAVAEVATGRESVADAVAIVEAALRLQPLLDKASRLRRASQNAAAVGPSAAPDGVKLTHNLSS